MEQHDQGADANVVGTVGETEQEDGSQVVDDLLLEILARQTYSEQNKRTIRCQQKTVTH